MCEFKSAIVTRQGNVLHHDMTDLHEDLIAYFGLRDDNHLNHFVRVEFKPTDKKDYADLSKYSLVVDEDEVPKWFEEFREKTISELTKIVSKYILKDVDKKIILDGCWIVTGATKIERMTAGRILTVSDSAKIDYVSGSAKIGNVSDSAKIGNVYDSAKIVNDKRIK